MKKLMTLGLLASSIVFADEGSEVVSIMKAPIDDCEVPVVEASYGYVNFGLGLFPLPMGWRTIVVPIPLLGVGGRYQKGQHGFDGSFQFISFKGFDTLQKKISTTFIQFKPNLASQWYVGGGVGVTQIWSRGHITPFLAPQMILGKQYTNKAGSARYFQAQIDPVSLDLKHTYKKGHPLIYPFPVIVLSYGICF